MTYEKGSSATDNILSADLLRIQSAPQRSIRGSISFPRPKDQSAATFLYLICSKHLCVLCGLRGEYVTEIPTRSTSLVFEDKIERPSMYTLQVMMLSA